MACGYCGKNQAVKTYEEIKGGKKRTEYYCLDCYRRLFLYTDGAEGELSLSACPYCETTVAEIKRTKIVGCANCYKALSDSLLPSIVKMQGVKAHRGKNPPLETVDLDEFLFEEDREKAIERARMQKRCNELEVIIAKLKSENNYEDARGYADKLSLLRAEESIEEEFVWRTRRNLSNQP